MKQHTNPYSTLEQEPLPRVAEETVACDVPQQIILDVPLGYDYTTLQTKVNAFYVQLLEETSVEEHFHTLLYRWEHETGILSNPFAILGNANFMEMVKMGKAVVPLILEEISKRPSLLYCALEMIYGETTCQPEREGRMTKLNVKDNCETWIEKLRK